MIYSFSAKNGSDSEFDVKLIKDYAEKQGLNFSKLVIQGLRTVIKDKGLLNANEQRRATNQNRG